MSSKAPRKTTLKHFEFEIEYDYDDVLKKLRESTEPDFLESLAYLSHWLIALKFLNLTEQKKKRFLECFNANGKEQNRIKCVLGNTWHNSKGLRDIIFNINHIKSIREMDDKAKQRESFKGAAMGLTATFMMLIDSKDSSTFSQLAKCLKTEQLPWDNATRGKEGVTADIWRTFCKLYLNEGELPTQVEVLKGIGLDPRIHAGDELNNRKKDLARLGLDGLPDS